MPTDRPDKDRPPSGAGDRRNTLRLTPRDLGTLLDRFDASEAAKANANREFIRWPFRYDAIQMVAQPLGGGVSKVTMACRNISRTGMSLLHSSFMHPGTKCTVLLPRPGRTEVPVRGWVAHCNHRSGMVHEIGINFTEPIEIREFIRPDPFADWFSLERIKPEDLTGCVLYVDDSEMDVRIVKHFLRGTCLSVRTASSSAAAVAALETQPDLIISDFMLGDGTGFDVMTSVRQRGYRGPFVLATSDTGEAARKAIAAHQPDACLAKPFKQDVLHRAIGEFLLVRRRPAGAKPAGAADPETAALVQTFVATLKPTIARIEAAIKSANMVQARTVCLQIAGTAPTLGFTELGEVAQGTARILSGSKSPADSVKALKALIAACERTKGRSAA